MIRFLRYATLSLLLASCASDSHLVFFTNTSIGFEVSSDATAGNPVKFLLGYKRQEGVIDPLVSGYDYQPAGAPPEPAVKASGPIVAAAHGYFVPKGTDMIPHSVLAKINFGSASGGTSATNAQWFATGKAAELLAANPAAAAAVTGQSNVTVTTSIAPLTPNGPLLPVVLDAYSEVKQAAADKSLTAEDTLQANKLLAAVDGLDKDELLVSLLVYERPDPNDPRLFRVHDWTRGGATGFENVVDYLDSLDRSFARAKEAVVVGKGALTLQRGTAAPAVASDADIAELVSFVSTAQAQRDKLARLIEGNRDVGALVDLWYQRVLHRSPANPNP